jgi:outer membrane receptor protein involved in Fe transport
MMKILLPFLCIPLSFFAQLSGKVVQTDNKEPIVGAKIEASTGEKALTDIEGRFTINASSFPVTLITSMATFTSDTLVIRASGEVVIALKPIVKEIEDVVVSAGRRRQRIEEVPISMELIKPALIDNKGINDLEQAVDQSPGTYTMDGQVSIRGGSGYSYGAGSRVLLLWNGMPLLSGYAGDTQWNAIPMEQASQIEIMKGASSVLYGSGALNGVIALTEKEPNLKPETKIKYQQGIYGNPKRATLKWWDQNPRFDLLEAYHGRMYKYAGFTLSTTLFNSGGYREGETERRGRISGSLYFRFKKTNKLKAGIGYNYQFQKTGNFLIWQSDTFAYTPSGGADTSLSTSTLTYNFGQRLFLDPYLKYTDKFNNKHALKTRMYFVNNANLTNTGQSNQAIVYFTDYQFQRQFGNGITITSGISNIYNVVKSQLFGDHTSNNASLYAQYEHKIAKKLDFTAGFRAEHYIMDGKTGDSDFSFGKKDTVTIPIYPIFRAGLHYELMPYTHLRASFGQGIRYPSVGERFIQTSVGSLNIFPNPVLRPEKGWAAEIGIKQGVKIGDWKGMIDIAGFVNEYSNMTEFAFGVYNPDTVTLTPDNITQWVGFRAENAESARISGIEFSFNSAGKIKKVEIISLLGYTYMNPITLNPDPTYLSTFSEPTSNLLKYRFRHLAKADVEVNYKKLSLGFSTRYNSHMTNIDYVFENPILGISILPGLKNYRQIYNTGNLVFDARFGWNFTEKYRFGFMVNNIFNAEISARPGDIQPPRTFIAQLLMKF